MLWDLIKLVLFVAVVVCVGAVVYDKKVKPVPVVEQVLTFLKSLPALVKNKLTSKS